MEILFVGIGSIAKRHIGNLKAILGDAVSISVLRSGIGLRLVDRDLAAIDHVCYNRSELKSRYDAVFITNPTSMHFKTLLCCHELSDAFFIEKPVFMTGDEDISRFSETNKIYYTACPLRYMKAIRYLKREIDFSRVYSMRCISSSYLPEWRPGTDYRNAYSARRDLGGGVSMDLIHEWDYIHYLAGSPIRVKNMIRKKSNLEIDSDDIAVYIAEYEDKIVELHLDYFGREPVRRIELFTADDTIAVDLLCQRIKWMRAGKMIEFPKDRNEYQKRELEHFLDIACGKSGNDNPLDVACKVLRIARGEF